MGRLDVERVTLRQLLRALSHFGDQPTAKMSSSPPLWPRRNTPKRESQVPELGLPHLLDTTGLNTPTARGGSPGGPCQPGCSLRMISSRKIRGRFA